VVVFSLVVTPSSLAGSERTIHGVGSRLPHRSSSPDDPIAAALALLRPTTTVEPSLHLPPTGAVPLQATDHVRIGALERGECLLLRDGFEPVRLVQGDLFLLQAPASYALEAVPGAGHTSLCGGSFLLDEQNAPLLLDVLPPLVHVRAGDPDYRPLALLTEVVSLEAAADGPGRSLVLDHLVQSLFVLVLRTHAGRDRRPVGWLGALQDNGVGAALRAVHADIAHRWTVQELAGIARMSRSSFAVAFREQVGTTPLEYLIQWRMNLARDALRRGRPSISEVAAATGYETESSFSTAFRRVVGVSPRTFRDGEPRFS
jgi:AraC-like DNA-binding protein